MKEVTDAKMRMDPRLIPRVNHVVNTIKKFGSMGDSSLDELLDTKVDLGGVDSKVCIDNHSLLGLSSCLLSPFQIDSSPDLSQKTLLWQTTGNRLGRYRSLLHGDQWCFQ